MSQIERKSILQQPLGYAIKILTGMVFLTVIALAFTTAKPVPGYGDEFRIFYFHVPCAIICFMAFFINLVYSIKYLRHKNYQDDIRAASAAEIGIVFGILATLTGAIFAKVTWGTYWNWDIRQTSIVVLLAVYGAYFAMRGAVEPEERKAAFSGVYSCLAFVAVPTFGFIIPRLYKSLHPGDTIVAQGKIAMGGMVALIFFGAVLGFGLLFWWLFNLRWRSIYLEHKSLEQGYE